MEINKEELEELIRKIVKEEVTKNLSIPGDITISDNKNSAVNLDLYLQWNKDTFDTTNLTSIDTYYI